MARPALVTKNTKELVLRAQAHARAGTYLGVNGLAVPHRKADQEAYFNNQPNDNRQAVRAEFGIPFPLLEAANILAENDGRTLVRIAQVFKAVGDGAHYTSVKANGILAKVNRGTLDIESFLDELKDGIS